MSKLEKMLERWVENNLLDRKQAKEIYAFEETRPGSSWVLYGFLALGALIIGIGVISLISANWRYLSNFFKLFLDFSLLGSLAFGVYWSWKQKREILFEVFLILFMVIILASIGLISQIYHTGGELYQALLMWSVITFGLALATKKYLTSFLWIGGFLTGITFTFLDSKFFILIFFRNGLPVFLAVPLLTSLFVIISKRFLGELPQTRALRTWAMIAGLSALFAVETRFWRYSSAVEYSSLAYIPGNILAIITAMGLWANNLYNKAQKILLSIALVFYVLQFHLPILDLHAKLLFAVVNLIIISLLAVFLASIKERRLFNIFLIILGLRFLVLYFQALGGLAATGVGLIVSGIVIIGIVAAWNKYRKAIMTWAEGLLE